VYRRGQLIPKALEKVFHDLLAAALGCEPSKNDEAADE
jgi:hypothetical protein